MAHRHRMYRRGGRADGGATGAHTVYSGAGSHVAKEAKSKADHFKKGGRHHVGKVHGGGAKGRLDKRARGGGVGHSPFSSASRMEDVHRTPKTKDTGMPRKHGGRTNPLHAKHPGNFGHHHGAGHERPLEHHLPVHHKHGGTPHHLAETHAAHGGAAGHGKSGHAPGGSHAGIHHPHKHGRKHRKHGGRTKDDDDEDEDDKKYADGGRYANKTDDDDDDDSPLKNAKEGAKEAGRTAMHAGLGAIGEKLSEAAVHAGKAALGVAAGKRGGRMASGGRAPHIDIYNTKGGNHHWIDKAAKGGGKK